MYIAHRNQENGAEQTLKDHSCNTAAYCQQFAIPEMKNMLYLMGLLHDAGKYQPSFARRIQGENVQVEHSICGAKLIAEQYGQTPAALLLEYCIAGHHTGLPDGGSPGDTSDMSTLQGRLKRETENFSDCRQELDIPALQQNSFLQLLQRNLQKDAHRANEQLVDKFAFFVRYAFSCLVDADSIDTAKFCGDDPCAYPLHANFKACLRRVDEHLQSLPSETELQKARRDLQRQAFERIQENAEIYLMNMPTGSGKTLCSVKCALERAIAGNKKRIIYVIPYNSIIDQTAEVFAEIFGEDAEILRHQSTFSAEDIGADDEFLHGVKFAGENWDCPFIITTAVQFFESLFSCRRKKLRKVHNMQDSVLVFDEAHLMPPSYLQPCLQAVGFITKYLNSEAIFLTATMPDFPALLEKYVMENNCVYNLIPDTHLFSVFQKCRYVNLGEISTASLLERSRACPSSLIIVNTRRAARELYRAADGCKYHLSTYMTAKDRAETLKEIRHELRRLERDYPDLEQVPAERRIVVISTSLIEAGVDLDVHTVFREMAGLDHILQAGGRCNREGKRKTATVYIYWTSEAGYGRQADLPTSLTMGLLQKYPEPDCLACISEFYSRLYFMRDYEITEYALHRQYTTLRSIGFRTYDESVRLIDTPSVSVVVPDDEVSESMVKAMKYGKYGNMRQLQKYTCSVYPNELQELLRQHAAADSGTGVYYLCNPDYYKKDTGISFETCDYIL